MASGVRLRVCVAARPAVSAVAGLAHLWRGGQECVRAHDEAGVDLGGEVFAGGGAGPGARVLEMELRGLAGERRPVLDLGVCCLLERGECLAGVVAEISQAEGVALFHRAHSRLMAEPGPQRLACVLARRNAASLPPWILLPTTASAT